MDQSSDPPPAASTDQSASQGFVLHLFVAGTMPKSRRAIANLRKLMAEHLPGSQLEVIDIYQQPERVREEEIVAVPTLIKKAPLPLRRFIGDLSDPSRVLLGLGLTPEG